MFSCVELGTLNNFLATRDEAYYIYTPTLR